MLFLATFFVATLSMLLGPSVALADEPVGTDVELSDQFEGVSNPGFAKIGSCGSAPTGDYAWHFILNGLDPGTPAGTLTAVFQPGGTHTVTGDPSGNGNTQHFYVYLNAPATLLSATASVAPQTGSPNLVLSHVATECLSAATSIHTVPNPITASVGDVLNDSATLEGGADPSGTITFALYGPESQACSGEPRYTETVAVNGAGTYATVTGFAADVAGTWQWVASYGGDGSNRPSADECGDEQVAVASSLSETVVLGDTSGNSGSTSSTSSSSFGSTDGTAATSGTSGTSGTESTGTADQPASGSGKPSTVLGGRFARTPELPVTGVALAVQGAFGAGFLLSGASLRRLARRAKEKVLAVCAAIPWVGFNARAARMLVETVRILDATPTARRQDLERALGRIVVAHAIRERARSTEIV